MSTGKGVVHSSGITTIFRLEIHSWKCRLTIGSPVLQDWNRWWILHVLNDSVVELIGHNFGKHWTALMIIALILLSLVIFMQGILCLNTFLRAIFPLCNISKVLLLPRAWLQRLYFHLRTTKATIHLSLIVFYITINLWWIVYQINKSLLWFIILFLLLS